MEVAESARKHLAGFADLVGDMFLDEDADGAHRFGIRRFRDQSHVIADGAVGHAANLWNSCLRAREAASQADMASESAKLSRATRCGHERQGHIMIAGDVCPGANVPWHLDALFEDADVSYIHLHNGKQGCFYCLARRAKGPRQDKPKLVRGSA